MKGINADLGIIKTDIAQVNGETDMVLKNNYTPVSIFNSIVNVMRFKLKGLVVTFFAILFLMSFEPSKGFCAEAGQNFVWVTPKWPGLTEEDDSGLYDELIEKTMEGLNIKRVFIPWRRARYSVLTGQADITGGIIRRENPVFHQSKCPIYIRTTGIAYYSELGATKSHLDLLGGQQGIAQIGFLDDKAELASHLSTVQLIAESADYLSMLLSGRKAYFIAPFELIKKDMALAIEQGRLGSLKSIVVEKLNKAPLYLTFSRTERGARLKSQFDKNIDKLFRSGELEKLYRKHGLELPADEKCFGV